MKKRTIQMMFTALCIITATQIGGVFSQFCDSETELTCCQSDDSDCPSGYYRDDSCDVTTMTPSVTTEGGDSSSTTVDLVTDSDVDINSTTDAVSFDEEMSTSPMPTYCKRCTLNCLNCTASGCSRCEDKYESVNGKCTLQDTSLPIAVIAGGAAGGVVIIIVIIVVAVCCCRRSRRSGMENMETALRNREHQVCRDDSPSASVVVEEESPQDPKQPVHHTYQNLAFKQENMSIQIEQGQDKVLRYTKDPTMKKADVVEEPIYGNQSVIEAVTLSELPPAPEPPSGLWNKKAMKVPESLPDEDGEMEEIYYNENAERSPDVANFTGEGVSDYGDGNGEEVYYNEDAIEENEEEELYVNYGPRK